MQPEFVFGFVNEQAFAFAGVLQIYAAPYPFPAEFVGFTAVNDN